MSDFETEDNQKVEEIWRSAFGKALFNAYSNERSIPGAMLFSKRLRVVKSMIKAMMVEETLIKLDKR